MEPDGEKSMTEVVLTTLAILVAAGMLALLCIVLNQWWMVE